MSKIDLLFSLSSSLREAVIWTRNQVLNLSERIVQFIDIFPENVEVYTPEDSEGLPVGTSCARLVVTPNLKDTWYKNPIKNEEVTNVPEQSDWSMHKTYFPTIGQRGNPVNVLPRDLNVCNVRKFLLPQSPEFIFPESLERFLKGPILVKNLTKCYKNSFESYGRINIEGGLWNMCSDVTIKIDRRIVDTEKMLRVAFREGCGTQQMLGLLAQRMNHNINDAETWSIQDWKDEYDFILKWVELAMLPSKKCNSLVAGAEVALKSHIRDKALSNLHAGREEKSTKERLRYSHFATDKVFGPLAKTQAEFFAHSNPLRNEYLFDDKPIQHVNDWKSPNPQVKRSFSSPYTSVKVSKPQRGAYKGGFSNPKVSLIPPSQAAQNYKSYMKNSGSQRNFQQAQFQRGRARGGRGRRGRAT